MCDELFQMCKWRKDRACCAAPYYGTADCDWVVDRDECPEPLDAIMTLRLCQEVDHGQKRK